MLLGQRHKQVARTDNLVNSGNADYSVSKRGNRLSMGQRQLVVLARMLAQNPRIFILDEATASIVPFTEAQIQQALDEQYSLRQSVMHLERDRVAERLKKLDEQLQTFDASREELLDRQLRLLLGKQKSATGKGS